MTGLGEELDAVADDLYALPPESFTAARARRAKQASGELGKRIGGLRKPSVAAWVMNLLVRDGQLAEVVQLSRALHEAQGDLDAAELTKLGGQRRALVSALVSRAADLAAGEGASLSPSTRDEVERTVNAAVLDATVANAVLTGRLVRTIHAGEDFDASDVVAGSLDAATTRATRDAPETDDLAARRARKTAERALRDAQRASAESERVLAEIIARIAKSTERLARLRERIEGLRRELDGLTREADDIAAEMERLGRDRSDAQRTATSAEEDVRRARAALEE